MTRPTTAWTRTLAGATALAVASCAAPPLAQYTLETAPQTPPSAPAGRPLVVIAVARVAIPDELDNEDIVLRSGSTLDRSGLGRWASRLSIEVTERITARLAERRSDALVTSEPQAQAPSYRLIINLSRLDLRTDGHVTVAADWVVMPRDPAVPVHRDRAEFSIEGSVAGDRNVVKLMDDALDQLSRSIALPPMIDGTGVAG